MANFPTAANVQRSEYGSPGVPKVPASAPRFELTTRDAVLLGHAADEAFGPDKRLEAEREAVRVEQGVTDATMRFDQADQEVRAMSGSRLDLADALTGRHAAIVKDVAGQFGDERMKATVLRRLEPVSRSYRIAGLNYVDQAGTDHLDNQIRQSLSAFGNSISRDDHPDLAALEYGAAGALSIAESGATLPAGRRDKLIADWNALVPETAIKALVDKGDSGRALDILKRGHLLDSGGMNFDSVLSPDRQAALRAYAEKRLGADVHEAVQVLDVGKVPPNLGQLTKATRGTEFGKHLDEAAADRASVAGFATMTLPDQANLLQSYAVNPVADLRTIRRAERFSKVHDATVKTLSAQLENAPPDQALAAINVLRRDYGSDGAMLVAGSLARKRPEIAMAVHLAGDRPQLAQDVLRGGDLLKKNPDVKPTREQRVSAVQSVLGGMFADTAGEMVDPIVEAASSLYASRRVPAGDMSYDSTAFEAAIKDVSGGVVEFNGRKMLAPVPGMDESKVVDVVRKLSADDLVKFGSGKPVFGDKTPFEPDQFHARNLGLFSGRAQLVSLLGGRYLVFVPGLGYVQSDKGGPYILNLRDRIEASR